MLCSGGILMFKHDTRTTQTAKLKHKEAFHTRARSRSCRSFCSSVPVAYIINLPTWREKKYSAIARTLYFAYFHREKNEHKRHGFRGWTDSYYRLELYKYDKKYHQFIKIRKKSRFAIKRTRVTLTTWALLYIKQSHSFTTNFINARGNIRLNMTLFGVFFVIDIFFLSCISVGNRVS